MLDGGSIGFRSRSPAARAARGGQGRGGRRAAARVGNGRRGSSGPSSAGRTTARPSGRRRQPIGRSRDANRPAPAHGACGPPVGRRPLGRERADGSGRRQRQPARRTARTCARRATGRPASGRGGRIRAACRSTAAPGRPSGDRCSADGRRRGRRPDGPGEEPRTGGETARRAAAGGADEPAARPTATRPRRPRAPTAPGRVGDAAQRGGGGRRRRGTSSAGGGPGRASRARTRSACRAPRTTSQRAGPLRRPRARKAPERQGGARPMLGVLRAGSVPRSGDARRRAARRDQASSTMPLSTSTRAARSTTARHERAEHGGRPSSRTFTGRRWRATTARRRRRVSGDRRWPGRRPDRPAGRASGPASGWP